MLNLDPIWHRTQDFLRCCIDQEESPSLWSGLVTFQLLGDEVEMKPIVIVGAGLSGLACAVTLQGHGREVLLLEASATIGGRVQTDTVDGFLLDRGFQVYLDAYPEAGEMLDLAALHLRAFEPGALVFNGSKLCRVMDVFRRPKDLVSSALAPIGTIFDKLRVAVLRQKVLDLEKSEIFKRRDQSTESYLQDFGFSVKMIDTFFRSFYGGIFLERELKTSSRMFEFTFKMFSEGSATVPAKGMGEIPRQLAARLPESAIRLKSLVSAVSADRVVLENGEEIEASQVVVATNAAAAARLVDGFDAFEPNWRAVTNLYFEAEASPLDGVIIALNGTQSGRVNNVAVMSDLAPDYAPNGKALISVSVLGENEGRDLPWVVQEELKDWFGEKVAAWKHLRTDLIKEALPTQEETNLIGFREIGGVFVCGDHAMSASIEGAISSGKSTAEAIVAIS